MNNASRQRLDAIILEPDAFLGAIAENWKIPALDANISRELSLSNYLSRAIMQSDLNYYGDLYRSTANPRAEEPKPERSTARRGTGGARLRGSGRGRGSRGGRMLARATAEGDLKLPRVNEYGRQTASSSASLFDKGGQYPDPTPTVPAKRRRTEMTEMLYGDDFPMNERPKDQDPTASRTRSPNPWESQSGWAFPGLDAADPPSSAQPEVADIGAAQDSSPTQESGKARRDKYTREQLRGPATAAGLPAFPHHSAPQAPPAVAPLKPAVTASGPVSRHSMFWSPCSPVVDPRRLHTRVRSRGARAQDCLCHS